MRNTLRRRPLAAIAASVGAIGLSGCIITPGNPGPADVTFTINATTNNAPISPLIYGANGGPNIGTNKFTVLRQGGNRWTAYNWENNYSNAGRDWYYQNDNYLSTSTTPGAAVTPTVDRATNAGAAALVTIPIVDYVAADALGGNEVNGDVRLTPNYLSVRMNQNKAAKGSAFTLTPNATDDFVYQDEFVNWLKTNRPSANIIISLDNEPDLWGRSDGTHPEVHPNAVTYAEIVQRNTDYAKAVKAVWPTVKITGPVNYGFAGFENLQNAPDANGRNFLDFYLDAMKAADTAAGKRLVDYLDLHWYPETRVPPGSDDWRITTTRTDASVVAAREQSPRSLWDPTFVEPHNWITATNGYNYGAIRLIPRMKAKIAAHYPGTKLAITEWHFGAGQHISGAIATADALGVFGREGVDLATLWEMGADESFTYAAFRAFRNYDGAGSTFGDTSVTATSSDVATATVYASKFAATPKKMVVVAINKANTTKSAAIMITCSAKFTKAKVFTITAAGGANLVAKPDILPAATNAWNYSMPAQSISVIVPE